MHGNIDMTGHQLVNLGDPVHGQLSTSKNFENNTQHLEPSQLLGVIPITS